MILRTCLRPLAAAAAAVTVSLALGVAPASAGSGPGGPASIVAPPGFAGAYAAEQHFVEATCLLPEPAITLAQAIYGSFEVALDGRLAAAGYGSSPSYADWANASKRCSKG